MHIEGGIIYAYSEQRWFIWLWKHHEQWPSFLSVLYKRRLWHWSMLLPGISQYVRLCLCEWRNTLCIFITYTSIGIIYTFNDLSLLAWNKDMRYKRDGICPRHASVSSHVFIISLYQFIIMSLLSVYINLLLCLYYQSDQYKKLRCTCCPNFDVSRTTFALT